MAAMDSFGLDWDLPSLSLEYDPGAASRPSSLSPPRQLTIWQQNIVPAPPAWPTKLIPPPQHERRPPPHTQPSASEYVSRRAEAQVLRIPPAVPLHYHQPHHQPHHQQRHQPQPPMGSPPHPSPHPQQPQHAQTQHAQHHQPQGEHDHQMHPHHGRWGVAPSASSSSSHACSQHHAATAHHHAAPSQCYYPPLSTSAGHPPPRSAQISAANWTPSSNGSGGPPRRMPTVALPFAKATYLHGPPHHGPQHYVAGPPPPMLHGGMHGGPPYHQTGAMKPTGAPGAPISTRKLGRAVRTRTPHEAPPCLYLPAPLLFQAARGLSPSEFFRIANPYPGSPCSRSGVVSHRNRHRPTSHGGAHLTAPPARPAQVKAPWTRQEDTMIRDGVLTRGYKWTAIAQVPIYICILLDYYTTTKKKGGGMYNCSILMCRKLQVAQVSSYRM